MAPGDAPGNGSAAGGYRQHRATPPTSSLGLQLPGGGGGQRVPPLLSPPPPATPPGLGVSALLSPSPGPSASRGPILLWDLLLYLRHGAPHPPGAVGAAVRRWSAK